MRAMAITTRRSLAGSRETHDPSSGGRGSLTPIQGTLITTPMLKSSCSLTTRLPTTLDPLSSQSPCPYHLPWELRQIRTSTYSPTRLARGPRSQHARSTHALWASVILRPHVRSFKNALSCRTETHRAGQLAPRSRQKGRARQHASTSQRSRPPRSVRPISLPSISPR